MHGNIPIFRPLLSYPISKSLEGNFSAEHDEYQDTTIFSVYQQDWCIPPSRKLLLQVRQRSQEDAKAACRDKILACISLHFSEQEEEKLQNTVSIAR